MILLLDTSTPLCRLILINGDQTYEAEWEAARELANGLLKYIDTQLQLHAKTWNDIEAIGVFRGPGSFTGLRIGLTVLNTIADTQQVPIVGALGEDWRTQVLARIKAGEDDKIILPHYGGDAHITKPRK